MQSKYHLSILTAGLIFCSGTNGLEQKICTGQSVSIFQCEISNGKNLALCGVYDQLAGLQGLQYVFGKANDVELIYPVGKVTTGDFKFNYYFRSGVEYLKVSFRNGSVKYSIFSNSDQNQPPGNSSGIEVFDDQKHSSEVQILCSKIYANKLRNLSRLKCDEDDALGCNN
ncbi:hypothetical protein [Pseudomonas sp. MH10]|uniref:hypothetical protein n=1 Tax=Pseudomonas sp. MH10 TaxID=3048627 RepID=UPI002AC8FD60|nr:hypothetical protein [Pseudomonas sp. MH10]WPX63011.1 hypothetical protein RHM59_19125 [Pseudomonas sp. MH10]